MISQKSKTKIKRIEKNIEKRESWQNSYFTVFDVLILASQKNQFHLLFAVTLSLFHTKHKSIAVVSSFTQETLLFVNPHRCHSKQFRIVVPLSQFFSFSSPPKKLFTKKHHLPDPFTSNLNWSETKQSDCTEPGKTSCK